jgi:hypothetical protein
MSCQRPPRSKLFVAARYPTQQNLFVVSSLPDVVVLLLLLLLVLVLIAKALTSQRPADGHRKFVFQTEL